MGKEQFDVYALLTPSAGDASEIRLRSPRKSNGFNQGLSAKRLFAEWTQDGELRQTTFLGWRKDKSPEEVVIEA
jgi:hypothetical protein